MLLLTQDAVNLITAVAVSHVVVFLGVLVAAMLYRQIRRFGFSHSWDAEDFEKDINL